MIKKKEWLISGVILALFWGALLYEYWTDLVPGVLRMVTTAQSAGAEKVDSHIFEILNSSNASTEQVKSVIRTLESQYQAIVDYTEAAPSEKISVVFINGQGPALTDGAQLIIYYDDGMMDIDLAPMYLVWLIEELPVNPQEGLVQSGGHALQVVEAAGLGAYLMRQPLDHWALLLEQENQYMPLEEAWQLNMPNDLEGAYDLMRGMLEAGSFMVWFTEKYGIETARQLASGEKIENLTGIYLVDHEVEWLKTLDEQKIEPKECELVIPEESVFRLICKNLAEAPE